MKRSTILGMTAGLAMLASVSMSAETPFVPFTADPAEGSTVPALSSVVVNFPDYFVYFFDQSIMPSVVLENTSVEPTVTYVCNDPQLIEKTATGTSYEFTFSREGQDVATVITQPGEYTLTVRNTYYKVDDKGAQMPIDFPLVINYTIEYPEDYILTPADGETVEVINNVSLEFPNTKDIIFADNSRMPVATLVNVFTGEEYYCFAADRDTRAMTDGILYNFQFVSAESAGEEGAEPVEILQNGEYLLTITGMMYESTEEILPPITAVYYINNPLVYYLAMGVDQIPLISGEQYDALLMPINIKFPYDVVIAPDYDPENPVHFATIVNTETGEMYWCDEPERITRTTAASEYNMTFYNEQGLMERIFWDGVYELEISGFKTVVNGVEEDVPTIEGTYYIGVPPVAPYILYPTEYETSSEAQANAYSVINMPISLWFTTAEGVYFNNPTITITQQTAPYKSFTCPTTLIEEEVVEEGSWFNFTFQNIEGVYATLDENGLYFISINGFYYSDGQAIEKITGYYYIDVNSGVATLIDGETVNVYNMNGVQVVRDGEISSLQNLQPGIYVVNGKKLVIR